LAEPLVGLARLFPGRHGHHIFRFDRGCPPIHALGHGGAVFVAGLASAIVFRLNSDTQYDKANQLRASRATIGCKDAQTISDECTALRAATESGDRSRNWSTAGFAVAGAALVGTLTYWYWPWRSEKASQSATAHLRIAPNLSEHVSGLMLSGDY